MHTPAISVIMPVYNAGQFLREAIESILNQSFVDFEFLIIDDCSTDDSYAVASSYTDPRIRLCRNEQNMGAGLTRNRAIAMARGKYVALIDSDDISVPDRLEKQHAFLEQNPDIGICSSGIIHFNNTGEIHRDMMPLTHERIKINMLMGCPMIQSVSMFRREEYLSTGCRYTNCVTEDMELYSRLINHMKMANLSEYLLLYRSWENQISTSRRKEQFECTRDIIGAILSRDSVELTPKELNIYAAFAQKIFDLGVNRSDFATMRKVLKKIVRANRLTHRYDTHFLAKQMYVAYSDVVKHYYNGRPTLRVKLLIFKLQLKSI